MARALRCALAQKIRDRSYSAWGPIRKEDEGFSKGEGGKRNLVLIFFFLLTRVYQRSVLVIRRVTNERVWEYLHVNEISRTRESGKRGGVVY